MATNQIKITAAISCKNGRFVFPQIGGVYTFPQTGFGGGVPGMVTLNFAMGSPVDEFLDLSELTSPGFLFMQNICPDDMGDNEIAWGPKVSGSLAPVFTLRPGAPVILEILPTTEIGFRPSFDGQRVQVVVFER